MKIIKDCIYGHIKISNFVKPFLDVPEFQRLRRIQQLGITHYIYPSATHTRFEHCLGTYHIAGVVIDHLRNFTHISEKHKNLIQLAGLYHDIGHFSFSHLFDKFLKNIELPEDIDPIFNFKNHEDRSIYILNIINRRLKLLDQDDEEFVANCISGNIPPNQPAYLFEIICNKLCGLDVDKMDYIYRDAYKINFAQFQSTYIINHMVISDDNHIAFNKKAYNDIDKLYYNRKQLFIDVYRHHTSLKIEKIYFCAMCRTNKELFKYGLFTTDSNIETLLRDNPDNEELFSLLDNRTFEHSCSICQSIPITFKFKESGNINQIIFT